MADVPLNPGPLDITNPLLSDNLQAQAINASIGGIVAAIPAPFVTTGTGANKALGYTVPGGTFALGEVFRVRGWGVNSADVNAKTITVAYGALTANAIVTGSGQIWEFEAYFQNVGTVASPVQSEMIRANTAATVVTTAGPANSTQSIAGPLDISVSLTAATAGTMTLNGCIIEKVQ